MRNNTIFLFFLCMIVTCKNNVTLNKEENIKEKVVSTEYRTPEFHVDDRADKIKKLAPAIASLFEEHAKQKNIPGIAYGIVVDNQLVIANAIGHINLEEELSASSQSAFRIASMTKSFTAMAIVLLRDRGLLRLEDEASKFIPALDKLEYLTKDAAPITIENLLTMTAGFPEDNPWGDRQLDETDQRLMDMVEEGISFSNIPAFKYEYSNLGYALLGNIISKVSGLPYHEFINKEILLPLGMHHTYWEYDKVPADQLALGYRFEEEKHLLEPMLHHGSFGAMGGLITSIEDYAKYVTYHLSAWPPRSDAEQGPLSRSSIRKMHTPRFSRLYANSKDYEGETCPRVSGYGYGLGISEDCKGLKRITHGGALPGFGSNFVLYPDQGIGLMAFCNLTYTTPWPLRAIDKLFFEEDLMEGRTIQVSDILEKRKEQVLELIQTWDESLENQILAENFYLDNTRSIYIQKVKSTLEEAGSIQKIGAIKALNQLRGNFKIEGEHKHINVFFKLSPEKDPKIQSLKLRLIE